MAKKSKGIDGGLIQLSIWVDGKSVKDFDLLKRILVAKEQITEEEAKKISTIVKEGYLTSVSYDPADKNHTIPQSYDLVARSFPTPQQLE